MQKYLRARLSAEGKEVGAHAVHVGCHCVLPLTHLPQGAGFRVWNFVLVFVCSFLFSGAWGLNFGFWVLGFEFWILGFEIWGLGSGF